MSPKTRPGDEEVVARGFCPEVLAVRPAVDSGFDRRGDVMDGAY